MPDHKHTNAYVMAICWLNIIKLLKADWELAEFN